MFIMYSKLFCKVLFEVLLLALVALPSESSKTSKLQTQCFVPTAVSESYLLNPFSELRPVRPALLGVMEVSRAWLKKVESCVFKNK